MSADEFAPAEFAAAFQRFLAWTEEAGDARAAPFSAMFTEHFGADPSEFPVTSEALTTCRTSSSRWTPSSPERTPNIASPGSRGRLSTSTCP